MYNNPYLYFLPVYSTSHQYLTFLQPPQPIQDSFVLNQAIKPISENKIFQNQLTQKVNLPQFNATNAVSHLKKKKKSIDTDFGIKTQKQDRNSYSNSFKIFMKYLRDLPKKDKELLQKILRKEKRQGGEKYSVDDFYKELDEKLPRKKTYIGSNEIKSISKGLNVTPQFSSTFRRLMRVFYKRQMLFSVLTSKRIVGKAKNKQIEEARVIYTNLEQKDD